MSDADLIRLSRTGDSSAVETLYKRHHDAGLRFARRLMTNKADADDIAQDAFMKVSTAIQRGNGPDIAFRPYLLRTVRSAAADRWDEQAKETPTYNTGDAPVEDASLANLVHRDDPELVMKAFQSLPVRWMTVLWHAEVEKEPPRRIAPILGIEPGAVSALLLRARKGLREAYLTAYAQAPARTDCEPTFPYLAATVLGTSSARDRRKVKEHARDCEDCAKVLAELSDVGGTMRGILAPSLLLPSGATFAGTQIAGKVGASKSVALLAGAAVLIAVVSVAASGAIDFKADSAALPAPLRAPSAQQSIPALAPPTSTSTAGAPTPQEPAAVDDAVSPVQSYPANITNQLFDAGNVPASAAQPARPPRPAPTAGTISAPLPPPASTPVASSMPSAAPSAGSSPTSTSAPTAVPTISPTNSPSPTPTQPPAEPGCTPLLILCLSFPAP